EYGNGVIFFVLYSISIIIHHQINSGQVWHFNRFGLRLTDSTPDSICNHQRFVDFLGTKVYGDDVIHFFNVSLTYHPSAEPADGLNWFFTADTLHHSSPNIFLSSS
ncbi:MAG: hypothetical protein ABFS17_08170, partial [Chloroflexota bacterium]